MRLPPPLDEHYRHFAPAIEHRLEEFKAPKSEHDIFYEFCYCICTPQSKARNAWQVVEQLRAAQFYEQGFDPTPVLADPAHYIRFHRTKARRLLALRTQFGAISAVLAQESTSQELRQWIAQNVAGLGSRKQATSSVILGASTSQLLIGTSSATLCAMVFSHVQSNHGRKRSIE